MIWQEFNVFIEKQRLPFNSWWNLSQATGCLGRVEEESTGNVSTAGCWNWHSFLCPVRADVVRFHRQELNVRGPRGSPVTCWGSSAGCRPQGFYLFSAQVPWHQVSVVYFPKKTSPKFGVWDLRQVRICGQVPYRSFAPLSRFQSSSPLTGWVILGNLITLPVPQLPYLLNGSTNGIRFIGWFSNLVK